MEKEKLYYYCVYHDRYRSGVRAPELDDTRVCEEPSDPRFYDDPALTFVDAVFAKDGFAATEIVEGRIGVECTFLVAKKIMYDFSTEGRPCQIIPFEENGETCFERRSEYGTEYFVMERTNTMPF